MATKFSKQDWTLGALYRLGSRRRFGRDTLTALMVERAGMKADKAAQLAGHWLGTLPFRKPA